MNKYNGWANYDTWLVALWLENDYNNYLLASRLSRDEVMDMSHEDLENMFYYSTDEPDFGNVDMQEIRQMFLEDIYDMNEGR